MQSCATGPNFGSQQFQYGIHFGLQSFLFESQAEVDSKHNLELVQSVGVQFKGNLHAKWFNMCTCMFVVSMVTAC